MSAPVDVLAVLGRLLAVANDDVQDHDEVTAIYAQGVEARAAITALLDAAGKAQDTNRIDYVLGRPDVSHLPPAEAVVFLRGWDAASEAVYRTGLRAALRAVGGAK